MIKKVENGMDHDRYYLQHNGRTYELDGKLKKMPEPYEIIEEDEVPVTVRGLASKATRGYRSDRDLIAHSWTNGTELDFKHYLKDRTLMIWGDNAYHRDKIGNMAWGYYAAREGVPEERARMGAWFQGAIFGSNGEDPLDQEMISAGYAQFQAESGP